MWMSFRTFLWLFLLLLSVLPSSLTQELLTDVLSLGKEQGISSSSSISAETLQRILRGVEAGNRDNIYFYGLLKLYGVSVSKDVGGAGVQFRRAASLGHREATTACGVMALTGATPAGQVDFHEALRRFREGVALGDLNAHWLLGKMLMEGKGVPHPSYLEAAVHFQKAADEGIPQALHHLALLYEYGRGVGQDLQRARELYAQAAEQHFLESMYHLALLYAYGRGVAQDMARARSLFDAAARMNHAPSMYYIGIYKTYGYGGTEVNYHQAINWFERAASMEDDRVREKAHSAAVELRTVLEDAQHKNEMIMDTFQKQSER